MKFILLSLNSGTDAQCAALWNEVERQLGTADDPLEILIDEEEGVSEFDPEWANTILVATYRSTKGRGCYFPRCYEERTTCKGCAHHRERQAR